MTKISQKDSQADFPITIRKLIRLGNAYAVTLPPSWVRSLNPGAVHYLRVQTTSDGSVVVRDLTDSAIRGDVQADPNSSDRP